MQITEHKPPYEVKTAVGNFSLPYEVVSTHKITHLANLFEDGVKGKQDVYQFLEKARQKLELSETEAEQTNACLIAVYEKLQELEAKGINGVWARIIKNAFAPLFVGQFNLIVGNPPWVNWESLPESYRKETKPLWIDYGLFSLRGHAARLGGGKKDISMLMTYISIDKYLKDYGKLCFLITQSVFKTSGAGEGFRSFKLGKNGVEFKIIQVDDMVVLQPFEGATNRTSVFTLQKGLKTEYPVSYVIWQKKEKGKINSDSSFDEVIKKTMRSNFKAKPINENYNAPWITGKGKTIEALTKIVKKSFYRAYAGAYNGGLAGVYWISILGRNSNLLSIRNLSDIGKKVVDPTECEIEEDFVFPLLRWSDMSKWCYSIKDAIIIPQDPKTRMGYDENYLMKNYPLTYNYFKEFEAVLWTRKSKIVRDIMEKSAFYAMFSVGSHTFSDYKVCWQRMSERLRATVVGKTNYNNIFNIDKSIIPQETIVFIPLADYDEAHYLCTLMNNSISDLIARSYSMGKSFGSPHLMNQIPIPKFNTYSSVHNELIRLSKLCHEKTTLGISVTDLEEQIDSLAAELWCLTNEELQDIKDSLAELR